MIQGYYFDKPMNAVDFQKKYSTKIAGSEARRKNNGKARK